MSKVIKINVNRADEQTFVHLFTCVCMHQSNGAKMEIEVNEIETEKINRTINKTHTPTKSHFLPLPNDFSQTETYPANSERFHSHCLHFPIAAMLLSSLVTVRAIIIARITYHNIQYIICV